MRLDRTVRYYVDVVLRDSKDPTMTFDKVVKDTQRKIGLTGPILLEVRDETVSVSYGGVITTKETPRED